MLTTTSAAAFACMARACAPPPVGTGGSSGSSGGGSAAAERRAKARARAETKRSAERADLLDKARKDPVISELDRALARGERMSAAARDIVERAMNGRPLSDAQRNVLVREVRYREERRARLEQAKADQAAGLSKPMPSGRTDVVGKVVSRKTVDTKYGRQAKILVQSDEGWRLWVSEPTMRDKDGNRLEAAIGDRIKMNTSVEPSKDDPQFGFGSRPTKAEIVPSPESQ